VSTQAIFAAALARLAVTSEIGSAQPTVSPHAQHDGDRPRGPRVTVADRLAERWERADNDAERRRVTLDAIDELRRTSHSPDPDARKREIAADPRPARVVAAVYGVSHTTVIAYRKRFPSDTVVPLESENSG